MGIHGETETIYLGGSYEYEIIDHTGEAVTVLEAGKVTGLTDTPQTIMLEYTFENPVVIAQPLSHAEGTAAVVRLSGVQGNQFTLEIEQPDGEDHTTGETVYYMVFEAGSWEIDLGGGSTLQVEAGLVDTGATVGKSVTNAWENVVYGTAFAAAPAVFTQVQTEYDAGWLTTRQRNVAASGFDMAMEVLDAQTTAHANEVLGWVAVEVGSGTLNGQIYEIDMTGPSVQDSWYDIVFTENHKPNVFFIASLATYNGDDGSHLRYQNETAAKVEIQVEEEDETSSHGSGEDVHYFRLSYQVSGGSLEATGTSTRVRKYYGAAMRDGEKLYYLLTDHLGSTSEVVRPEFDTANLQNIIVSQMRYLPFGGSRLASAKRPTDKTYTGQYEDSYIKLNFYGARWYDPALGRFISADTIVPGAGNPMAYDRYSYVFNNPMRFIDPSGHGACDGPYTVPECEEIDADGDGKVPYPVSLNENGQRMKELFDAFRDKYPTANIDDFTVWILSGEFSGLEGAVEFEPDLAELLAHTAMHWLIINEGNTSENAILNWLWAMESGRRRWEIWNDSGNIAGAGSAVELATEVVDLMRNSADEEWYRTEGNYWNDGWSPVNLPPHGYTWGNAYMYPDLSIAQLEALITAGGAEDIIFKWGDGSTTFYVLSIWQSNQICQYNIYYSPCQE